MVKPGWKPGETIRATETCLTSPSDDEVPGISEPPPKQRPRKLKEKEEEEEEEQNQEQEQEQQEEERER